MNIASLTERPLIMRAAMPRSHASNLPTYTYLQADGTWDMFDTAVRYTCDVPLVAAHPDATVELINDLPRDLDGWPFDPNDGAFTWRLTKCCAAGSSIGDLGLYCKSCYYGQDPQADTPPRLDAEWKPGNGPITLPLETR